MWSLSILTLLNVAQIIEVIFQARWHSLIPYHWQTLKVWRTLQSGNDTVFFELYPSGGFTGLYVDAIRVGISSWYLNSLQPILISRFILNLKRSAKGGTDVPSTIDYNRATDVIFINPTSTNALGVLLEEMDRPLSHGFLEEDTALTGEVETPC